MSIARLRVLAIAVALAGSGVAISLLHAQTHPDWKVGDVFVAIGNGKYEVCAQEQRLPGETNDHDHRLR